MTFNCTNITWDCGPYPYGPIWYLINLPLLLYGWTWIYQTEVWIMITLTIGMLGLSRHYYYGLGFTIVAVLFMQSGQPYLISSLCLLALGIIHPAFTILSIFDRLPLGTSFDFTHSGTWTERTHLERYLLFGIWWITEVIYCIAKYGGIYGIIDRIRK